MPQAAAIQFILFVACLTDCSAGNYEPEELASDDVIDCRVAAGSRLLIAVLIIRGAQWAARWRMSRDCHLYHL